jgi:hypothetical protein
MTTSEATAIVVCPVIWLPIQEPVMDGLRMALLAKAVAVLTDTK